MRNNSLAELAAIIHDGLPKLDNREIKALVRQICRQLGGVDIYLPQHRSDTQAVRILEEIFIDQFGNTGLADLENLLSKYGGSSLYVPREASAFRRDIALEIVEDKDSGEFSRIDLSQRYGITARSVRDLYNYGQKLRMQQREQKLF